MTRNTLIFEPGIKMGMSREGFRSFVIGIDCKLWPHEGTECNAKDGYKAKK